ncbi:MAG: ISL3 family transposase, partial [Acidimicrobiia bacterium]
EVEGELWIGVETTMEVVGCPDCGSRAKSKGRRRTVVRDLPAGGRPVRLVWRKRRWACPEVDCERRSWSETHPEIRPRAVLSERARRWAFSQVGEKGRTVASVAADLGVGWHTVMDAVREHGQPLVEALSLEGVSALGMDEHRWRHRPRGWAIGFCDLDTGRLIDIIEGRSAAGISRFLAAQPPEIRVRIETVSVDPWRGYLRPVRSLLSGAQIVVDHFHLIRLANQMVTEVRQRTQQEVTGHRGRKGDPLYGIRHLLLRGRERLTIRAQERIMMALDHPDGDRWDEIGCAWWGKELLRDVYAADGLAQARRALQEFYGWVEKVAVPELSRLARTVRQWEAEILAYHQQKYSNSKTEAANLIVEKQRRAAHGYRNFDNYRLRLLLNHGVKWDTQPTTKIRSHKPPMVA